jgi:hypothetical protein
MSQVGFTPIQIYRSSTAAAVPTAGNLVAGELAINTTDEKLYFENTGGTVTLLASSAAAGGTFTTVTATTVVNGLGAVGTPSYTFTGDLNTGMWSPAADTIAFSEGGAEAMRIDSSGNLGIGTTTPGTKLEVTGDITQTWATSMDRFIGSKFSTSYEVGLHLLEATRETRVTSKAADGTGLISLYTGVTPTERMRISSSGFVGIGTTGPTTLLDIRGAAVGGNFSAISIDNTSAGSGSPANTVSLNFSNAGSVKASITGAVYGDGYMAFATNTNTEKMRLTAAGNLGIGTTAPAAKLDVTATNGASGLNVLTPYGGNVVASGVFTSGNNSGLFGGGFGLKVFDKNDNGGGSTSGYGVYVSSPYDGVNASGNTYSLNKYGIFVDDLYGFNGVNAANTWGVYAKGGLNNYFAGNVGIGNTAPNTKLDVSGSITSRSGSIIADTLTNYGTNLVINAAGGLDTIFQTNGTERMRLTTGGIFLVGATSSLGSGAVRAQIGSAASAASGFLLKSTTASISLYASSGTGSYQSWPTGGFMAFGAGPTDGSTFAEAMRIDTTGNVLMGTSSSLFSNVVRLEVLAPANNHGTMSTVPTAAYQPYIAHNSATAGDNNFMAFGTEAAYTGRGGISYNRAAGLVSFNTTSDYRAKEVFGPVENPGDTIDSLKVYTGKMLDATQSRPMLIAHEAQAVAPYAVTGEKDAVNEDGTPHYQQMDTSALVPLLIAEVQSLRARVAQLEGK